MQMFEMKSTLEVNEEEMMRKWKDVLLREKLKNDLVMPNDGVDSKNTI